VAARASSPGGAHRRAEETTGQTPGTGTLKPLLDRFDVDWPEKKKTASI